MSTKHFGKRSAKLLLFVVVGLLLLPSSLILAKDVNMELLFTKTEAVSIMEELAKKYNDVHPNVFIEVNAPPDARWTVIPTRMATGNSPEILSHYPPTVDFRVLAREGYLLDLTDQPFMDRIQEELIERTAFEGRNYALPLSLNTVGVFYNTEMFAEHGWSIPKTYGEFLELCQTIQEAGITPLVFTDLDAWTAQQEFFLLMGIDVGRDTETFFVEVAEGRASVSEHPGYIRAAEKLLEIREYGMAGSLGIDYTTGIANFAQGNVAMYRQGIWAIPSIRQANPELKFKMFPFPADKAEDTKVMVGVDLALCLPSEGYLPDALGFLEFMTEQESAEYYAEKDGSFSLVKGVETRAPEIELMGEYIDSGLVFIWPKHLQGWGAGAPEEFSTLVQELVSFHDISLFLQESDRALRETP